MDIQFAYNIERMLYYICNEDSSVIKQIMDQVEKQFSYEVNAKGVILDSNIVNLISETFISYSVSDEDTLKTIRSFYDEFGYLLCPHSAIGVYAALDTLNHNSDTIPLVCVLTAHPAKFSETIEKAFQTNNPLSRSFTADLPTEILNLKGLPTKYKWLRKFVDDSKSQEEILNWRDQWIQQLKLDIVCNNKDTTCA